jgi:glutamate-1-semialdehyde 2,1-aminomutase
MMGTAHPTNNFQNPNIRPQFLITRKALQATMNPNQIKHLEMLIARYNQRTKTSKELTQTYRPFLADPRVPSGFNLATKEMCYPIIGKSSQGSKMWDIDGNQYVDFLMGLGVNLFGHNPPFIKEALEEQLDKGIQLGPQSEFVGEVAELFCSLTGMERVAFSNTGTEAIMTGIRLARTLTGRNKIVIFSGSYHGHFDGTLAEAKTVDGHLQVVPIAPGIPNNFIEDVLVLEYGNPQSLEAIAAHANQLAAVLVEPVQSNVLHIQPKAFLQQLRNLTRESGITLIFDEMITGFRIHPGGAQAWFGVEADLATYGKIVGGGLPIGIIAGKAIYMDAVDGGMWNYGDSSCPQAQTTFVAGTFCKHPLAIAAARAVLKYLKIKGATLQEQLNQRTLQFVNALNAYFEEDKVPFRLTNFGSLFGPDFTKISEFSEGLNLLPFHLLHRGIILRGAGGYLSTAHTDEDLDYMIQAIKDSVQELRSGGFLLSQSYNYAKI